MHPKLQKLQEDNEAAELRFGTKESRYFFPKGDVVRRRSAISRQTPFVDLDVVPNYTEFLKAILVVNMLNKDNRRRRRRELVQGHYITETLHPEFNELRDTLRKDETQTELVDDVFSNYLKLEDLILNNCAKTMTKLTSIKVGDAKLSTNIPAILRKCLQSRD